MKTHEYTLLNYFSILREAYTSGVRSRGTIGQDVTLTKGTDVEIAQFRKRGNEGWVRVKLNPEEDCLPKMNR